MLGAKEDILCLGQTFSGEVFLGSSLKHITIPHTLRTIEQGTFKCCNELKQIQLPEGVQTIASDSFYWSGLEEITLPATVRKVAQGAFAMCYNLRKITLNDGLEALGTDE